MRYGPTTVTYNALIFNFISVGDLHMCIKDYKDMMEKNYLYAALTFFCSSILLYILIYYLS
jgi:pentatricopeptide repeat protein